jgi:hypothetical protein
LVARRLLLMAGNVATVVVVVVDFRHVVQVHLLVAEVLVEVVDRPVRANRVRGLAELLCLGGVT